MGVKCVGRRLDQVRKDVGIAPVTLNHSETQSADLGGVVVPHGPRRSNRYFWPTAPRMGTPERRQQNQCDDGHHEHCEREGYTLCNKIKCDKRIGFKEA